MHFEHLSTLDLYSRGHEYDSEGVETCHPKITFYVIILLCLTDMLYCIHIDKHIGMTNNELKHQFTIHPVFLVYIKWNSLHTLYFQLTSLFSPHVGQAFKNSNFTASICYMHLSFRISV